MSFILDSSMEALPVWLAIPVIILLVLGGLITFTGALGLLRLPSFYQRIHGPAVFITMGTGCFLIASMLYFSSSQERPVVHELLITVFVLLTAPVTSMLLMRASVYRDIRAKGMAVTPDEVYHFPGEDKQQKQQD